MDKERDASSPAALRPAVTPMIDINHLKHVLDDSQHPGTAPAWVAIMMALLVIRLLIAHLKSLFTTSEGNSSE